MRTKAIPCDGAGIYLLAIIVSFMFSCSGERKTEVRTGIADSLIAQLKQGDLALRRGRDVASYMIAQANVADKRYSHCGLVQVEQGYPFVYHFINGQERNGLVRDSATAFFSQEQNSHAAVMRYSMTTTQLAEQASLIKQYYSRQPGFDMDFDSNTGDKLYCSEFVYRVMNAVMKDSAYIKPAMKNGFAYIPVDRLYADSIAETIWQMSFK